MLTILKWLKRPKEHLRPSLSPEEVLEFETKLNNSIQTDRGVAIHEAGHAIAQIHLLQEQLLILNKACCHKTVIRTNFGSAMNHAAGIMANMIDQDIPKNKRNLLFQQLLQGKLHEVGTGVSMPQEGGDLETLLMLNPNSSTLVSMLNQTCKLVESCWSHVEKLAKEFEAHKHTIYSISAASDPVLYSDVKKLGKHIKCAYGTKSSTKEIGKWEPILGSSGDEQVRVLWLNS